MSPPEAAMAGAGHILRRIRFRVVMPMVRYPQHRLTRCVENREEYENVLDYAVEPQRPVRKRSVIADRSSETADRSDGQSR